MGNYYCYFCPSDKHDLCKNKICIFDDALWTVEKNIARISKKSRYVEYSLQTYYRRWNTNMDVKKLEKLNKMLLKDLQIQTNFLDYMLNE